MRFGGYDKTRVFDSQEREELKAEFKSIWHSLLRNFERCLQDWMLRRRHSDNDNPTSGEEELSVLRHCYGGVNRSCAAACVILMFFASLRLEEALALWVRRRAYYASFFTTGTTCSMP